jgi:hypothetical protein
MKTIRTGVVGVGQMGINHARIYSELLGSRLAAVFDTNREAAAAAAENFKCQAASSLEEFASLVDAATICTPTVTHHATGMELLGRGKHLLIEKPIADTPAHARELAETAALQGCVLQVGHVERFNPVLHPLDSINHSRKLPLGLPFKSRHHDTGDPSLFSSLDHKPRILTATGDEEQRGCVLRGDHSQGSIPQIIESIHAEIAAPRRRWLFFHRASGVPAARWKDKTRLIGFIRVHDYLRRLASTREAAPLSNKLTRAIVVGEVFGKGRAVDADEEVFSDFMVQMGGIHAAVRSNCSDLLTTRNLLTFANHDLVEMGIHGIHGLKLSALDECVPHDHNIPPTHASIHGKCHIAIADAIDRGTKIAIPASHTIPVLTRMVGQEPSGHVVTIGIRFADRHVKTIRHSHCDTIIPGDSHKASHEKHKKNPKQPALHEGEI